MKFKFQTIRHKIIICFSIIVIGFFASGVYNLLAIFTIKNHLTKIVEEDFPAVNLTSKMLKEILTTTKLIVDATKDDTNKLEQYKQQLLAKNTFIVQLNLQLTTLVKSNNLFTETLAKNHQRISSFFTLGEKILQMYEENKQKFLKIKVETDDLEIAQKDMISAIEAQLDAVQGNIAAIRILHNIKNTLNISQLLYLELVGSKKLVDLAPADQQIKNNVQLVKKQLTEIIALNIVDPFSFKVARDAINVLLVAYEVEHGAYQQLKNYLHSNNEMLDALSFLDQMTNTLTDELLNLVQQANQMVDEARNNTNIIIADSITVTVLLGVLELCIAIVIALWIINAISKPLNIVVGMIRKVANGDLTKNIVYDKQDEFGILINCMNNLSDNLKKILTDMINISQALTEAARKNATLSDGTKQVAQQQHQKINVADVAMTETNAAIKSIVNHNAETLEELKLAKEKANTGQGLVTGVHVALETLDDQISTTSNIVHKVEANVVAISKIVRTVNDITEQTKLLALNASIEAARAGEHGRGFAVVADEVRNLAKHTQESTEEINKMVLNLEAGSKQAVQAMEKSSNEVRVVKNNTAQSGQTLLDIVNYVDQLLEHIGQVVIAVEQQSITINAATESLNVITALAQETEHSSDDSHENSISVLKLAENLAGMISYFKIR